MLIQMVEEQKQALAQAQKEVQSCPVDTIKSLQKESLRTRLMKLQKAQVKQNTTEDTPNSIDN